MSIFVVCHGLTTIPRLCDDGIGQVNKFDDFVGTNVNGSFFLNRTTTLRTFITQ